MGIDGVKGPGGGVSPTSAPSTGEKTFEGPTSSGPSKAGVERTGSAPLARLQSGEISVDEYLDWQVQEAAAHLQGKLPQEQLEFVQQSLREQLSQDPVLVELVRRTTGARPQE
jgi:hypothetical protein